MSADILLSMLDKVRRTGHDRWLACCPSHDDRSPSLSVRELYDGRILVHCFGGCAVEAILGAVGLTFDALYPEKQIQHGKPERRPFPAADILRGIAHEVLIVYLCTKHVANGKALPEHDQNRLLLAASRIQAALHAGGINYA